MVEIRIIKINIFKYIPFYKKNFDDKKTSRLETFGTNEMQTQPQKVWYEAKIWALTSQHNALIQFLFKELQPK